MCWRNTEVAKLFERWRGGECLQIRKGCRDHKLTMSVNEFLSEPLTCTCFHEWHHSLVSKLNRPAIDDHSILLTEWRGAAMWSTALCRAVQKCLLWQNDRVNADSVLFGTGGFCRLGYVSNATTSRCFAVTINQNRTGRIKIEQVTSKQNKQIQNRTG